MLFPVEGNIVGVKGFLMDFQELGCGGVDWIELAQGRDRSRALLTAVMYLWVS
jgi:hypothetical protein